MGIRSRLAATALAAIFTVSLTGSVLAQDAQTQPSPAAAATSSSQVPQAETGVNWPGAGYGAAALFGNVLYIPAKLVYAIVGSLVGGGTWLVTAGNTQAADTVWRSALGGDYVLTPQMIAGEQPINFSGPTEIPPAPPANAEASADGGNVQPIAPLPPPSAAPSPAAAPAASTSNAGGMHPLDAGSGPVNSKSAAAMPSTSIE